MLPVNNPLKVIAADILGLAKGAEWADNTSCHEILNAAYCKDVFSDRAGNDDYVLTLIAISGNADFLVSTTT